MSRKARYDTGRLLIAVTLFFAGGVAFSQNPKGITTTSTAPASPVSGKTRALVVGISNYEYIDKLQYADRDAEIFAEYLGNSHFWGVDKDDITLLVNEKARNGDIIAQLARLAQIAQPGDNLVFYFSGHGDVETITQFNNGYLLAYDTYSNNYIAGALPVSFLKELFVTLLNKQIKVIMITDACKSGKLAGGLKGAEYVASSIAHVWNNEIKILSTQPGKLSYEDAKWGKGRGVFSYYLVKGLNGEADANKDSVITLVELDNYVGSNVARETGNEQQPIIEGPNKYSTVIVNLGTVKASVPPAKLPGNSFRPGRTRYFIPADSCLYYYNEMNRAIEEKRFGYPENNSATGYYRKLKSCSRDTGFILQANSQLLAGLMNNIQDIVTNSFIGKKLVSQEKFDQGIQYVDLVLQHNDLHLPYDRHLLNLKRYLNVLGHATWSDSVHADIWEPLIDSALKEEPDAAYLFVASGTVEMRKDNLDKAIGLLQEAIRQSPGWLIPKYLLGLCYGQKKNYKQALAYFEEVLQKDSSYRTFECTKCILERMAEYALKSKQEKKCIDYLFKCIDLFPDYGPAYDALYDYATGKKDKAVTLRFIDRLKKSDDSIYNRLTRLQLQKEVFGIPLTQQALDSARFLLHDKSDSAYYYSVMGDYYSEKKNFNFDSAYFYYIGSIDLDSTEMAYVLDFSEFLAKRHANSEIQDLLTSRIPLFKDEEKAQLQEQLANSYLSSGDYQEAYDIARELVAGGYLTCTDMRKMRKAFKDIPGFEEYMKNCRDKPREE